MKHSILLTLLAFFLAFPAFAQRPDLSDETEGQIDSLLADMSIYEALPSGLTLNQSGKIRTALEDQISGNAEKKFYGYRVRIYLGSSQTARDASAHVYASFRKLYPDIPSYRIYNSPNFRVVAGNFRTRLEAETFARSIKGSFPSATVVRDRFKYPAIGSVNMTARDTTALGDAL